ncbi:IclR family transcriptional regulator [Cupriavidus sp. 8B]
MIVDISTARYAKGEGPAPSLERGLRLLMELVRHRAPMTAPEISRRLSLSRIAVFRLLATLEATGFVERAGAGRGYRAGVGVLRLGFGQLASMDLTELGSPLLKRLSDEVGYPCHLAVRDGPWIVYVAKADPNSWLFGNVAVGTSLPAYATMPGRVLLGELSLSQLRSLYPETELRARAGQASQTVMDLFEEVRRDYQRGYVMHENGFEVDVAAVAVPVRDALGTIVAALGVIVKPTCPNGEEMERLTAKMREAAADLSCLVDERDFDSRHVGANGGAV